MKTHWNPAAKSTSSSTIKSLNKLLKLSLLSLWKIIFLLVDISLSKITIKIAFYHSKIIHDKFILPRCSNLRKKCFIFFVPFHWWNDVNSFQPIANFILTLLCILFSKRWKRRVEEEWSLSLSLYIYIYRDSMLYRGFVVAWFVKKRNEGKNGILLQALFPKQWERSTEVFHNIEQHISRVPSAFRTRSIPSGIRVFLMTVTPKDLGNRHLYRVPGGGMRASMWNAEERVSKYLLNCCWQQVFHQVSRLK